LERKICEENGKGRGDENVNLNDESENGNMNVNFETDCTPLRPHPRSCREHLFPRKYEGVVRNDSPHVSLCTGCYKRKKARLHLQA
jgi:hypothetical protein